MLNQLLGPPSSAISLHSGKPLGRGREVGEKTGPESDMTTRAVGGSRDANWSVQHLQMSRCGKLEAETTGFRLQRETRKEN